MSFWQFGLKNSPALYHPRFVTDCVESGSQASSKDTQLYTYMNRMPISKLSVGSYDGLFDCSRGPGNPSVSKKLTVFIEYTVLPSEGPLDYMIRQ